MPADDEDARPLRPSGQASSPAKRRIPRIPVVEERPEARDIGRSFAGEATGLVGIHLDIEQFDGAGPDGQRSGIPTCLTG